MLAYVLSNVLTHLILLPFPVMETIHSVLQKLKMRFQEFIYIELVAEKIPERQKQRLPSQGICCSYTLKHPQVTLFPTY